MSARIDPDEGNLCPGCNGSGEGQFEGSRCATCGGSGDDLQPWGRREREDSDDAHDERRERWSMQGADSMWDFP